MDYENVPAASHEEFTLYQEKLHASVHFLGILFGLIAIPLLILSANDQDVYSLSGVTIYGICFLMVFTFSTLYHACLAGKLKRLFKKLDRISIYFLIAGTYTPIITFYMPGSTGQNFLCLLWALVIFGILFEVYFPDRYAVLSVMFYLSMGLLFLIMPERIFASMPLQIASLAISGIILYFIGVFFYVWHKWEYHHVVWHLFVLSGAMCHYFAILYSV